MNDDIIDRDYVYEKIDTFLNLEYEFNAKRCLFYIIDCDVELRDVEIIAQFCRFLNKYN